jgi:DNA-binding GntR family transcriptional regulator
MEMRVALKGIVTQRRRLADEVYDQLVEAIVNQQITAEDRLVQEKLAAELEISRTPVREALMRLEKEGVLMAAASGGFRLAQMDEAEVKQLYQARAAIEGQCARILAVRATDAQIAKLRRIIEDEENLTELTTASYFQANRNIHRAFVEEAGNKFLLDMFDMIWGKAMAFHLFATLQNVDISRSLGNHLALVDVIATKDPAKTLEAFIAHIQDGFDLQIDGLRAEIKP